MFIYYNNITFGSVVVVADLDLAGTFGLTPVLATAGCFGLVSVVAGQVIN